MNKYLLDFCYLVTAHIQYINKLIRGSLFNLINKKSMISVGKLIFNIVYSIMTCGVTNVGLGFTTLIYKSLNILNALENKKGDMDFP